MLPVTIVLKTGTSPNPRNLCGYLDPNLLIHQRWSHQKEKAIVSQSNIPSIKEYITTLTNSHLTLFTLADSTRYDNFFDCFHKSSFSVLTIVDRYAFYPDHDTALVITIRFRFQTHFHIQRLIFIVLISTDHLTVKIVVILENWFIFSDILLEQIRDQLRTNEQLTEEMCEWGLTSSLRLNFQNSSSPSCKRHLKANSRMQNMAYPDKQP